jgi:malate synthase
MKTPNQIGRTLPEVHITPKDLLTVPEGKITEEGLKWNIDVGLQYVESWLRANGCVPIYNLMEDAATAEICRAQVWQWVRHGAKITDDGRTITADMVRSLIPEQKRKLQGARADKAAAIFERLAINPDFPEFLTLVAYDWID